MRTIIKNRVANSTTTRCLLFGKFKGSLRNGSGAKYCKYAEYCPNKFLARVRFGRAPRKRYTVCSSKTTCNQQTLNRDEAHIKDEV